MPRARTLSTSVHRRRVLLLSALGGLSWFSVSESAAFDYREPDAPVALSHVEVLSPRPRIALVLGAGGPRGCAHIGVMRVLEEANLLPDLIVGTNVGALLGVLWASGLSATQLHERSTRDGLISLLDPSPFADRGWIHGQRLQDYVNTAVSGKRLQDLPCKVIVVATRRQDRTPRFFTTGNTGVAVRASAAIPGIVSPVGIAGVEYEDGDSSLPLAVTAARAAGARFVIAVNVYAGPEGTPADISTELRARDVERRARIEQEVARADFLLHPPVAYHASLLPDFAEDCRRIGEATARAKLPAMRDMLSRTAPQAVFVTQTSRSASMNGAAEAGAGRRASRSTSTW